MKYARQSFIVAALLASLAGGSVLAQATPGTGAQQQPQPQQAPRGEHRHGPKDPAERQARFDKRMSELKQKLQITSAQEGAWNSFVQALRPPAQPPQRPDREALARMTTPERIDQMRALHAQRMAEMDRRGEATKSFYATLTPEQKKTFDEQGLRGPRGHGMQPGGGMHRHHG